MKLHANVCSQWEWTKLRQLLVIVLLGLGIVSTYGQTKTVSGIVKSESGGEPLVGATVKVKETNTGGITDIDGRYTIQANLGQTLIVSYIGYRTKEVKVERTIRIDILLQEDNEMLDEVVVVGYGTMKRSDLTGSVVSVTGDELKKSVVTSLDQALQGRAAGVQVTQNSGTPGGGISVSIRGINSLNGNEPLYVIDGVAISGNNTSNSSVLSSINPADIVSMEVLKDASATAIYGSRASNGVVLITTRQGEEGKTKVSYEGYYALQQLPKKLETLTLPEYAVYQNLRAATIGFGAREEFKDPSLLSRGTDWQNEIFRTAPMHNHQINISGGSKSMKYSLSGGYMQQDGIVFGSDFERFSFRVNMDNDINKWLTTGLRASVARTQQTNNVDGSGAIYNALNQLPEVPARNPDGSFGMQTENMYGTYFSNPLSDLIQNENYSRNTQVYVNAFADIKLWKGLVFRTEYAANFNYSNDYKFTPSYDYEHFKQQSSASRGAGNGSNWTLKTYFTYNNTFGKHGLSAMLGHEAQENKYESLSGSRTNFLFNSVHELDAGDATTAKANSSRGSSAIESYFGRLNYNYNDRYLLTATLRADGSSSFAKESRWGWFPSVALAWKVNNEAFLKDVEAINSLKLRLGWGVVGNQWAGSYAYGVTMASAASIWGTGFYAGNYPNRELKWEETNSFNVGLDLALFNNRIEFIADAYYKKTDNLLMQASLPTYVSGLIRAPWVNAGAMTNKGVEFTLNTHNIQTRDFTWTSGLTFSINHNEVTKLYSESSAISGINGSETLTYTMVGDWIDPSNILNYEQAWGSPIITQEIIEGYAKAGYSSLRIPVSWGNLLSDDFKVHPDLMDRVEKILNWTLDCGMVAIINIHHENEWIKQVPTDSKAKEKFTSIWKQICERFEKYGDHLLFEPMNEIGYDEIWTPWGGSEADKAKALGYVNDLNQLFVDIVRNSGGSNAKRHLLVEIYNTNLEYAYDPLFKMPNDPANRLALTVHYYTPANFAILGGGEVVDWGVGRESWGTEADFKELNDNMDLLKKNCVDKGIPVIIGEYCADSRNRTKEVIRLFCVSVTEAIYSRGMCPMLWDTPGGQYNRQTCQFDDPLFLEEMMAIPVKYPRN